MPDCTLINGHIQLTIKGWIAPCCNYDTWYMKDRFYDYNEYRESAFHKGMSKDMEGDGWHKGCSQCQATEELGVSGKYSHRELYSSLGMGEKVKFIELALSPKCNLSCRICGPSYSTTWKKLCESNIEETSPYKMVTDYTEEPISEMLKKLLDKIDLSELKALKLLGGEPFYPGSIEPMMEYLSKRGVDLSEVQFQTNTNATFFPKQSLVKELLKFKKVDLTLSMDGTDKCLEYGREGSVWSVVDEVVSKWKNVSSENDNFTLHIHCVVSSLSVAHIQDINLYGIRNGIDINYNHNVHPKEMSINALPEKYIESIKDKHNSIFISGYDRKFDPEAFGHLVKYTKMMDKITGKHMRDYLPELAKYVYDDNEIELLNV